MKLLIRLALAALALGLVGALAVYWLLFMPNTPDYDGFRGTKLPQGASFEVIADSLGSAGLLASSASFEWAATLTGWGRQLKPGYYRFEAGARNWDILRKIRAGRQDPVRVTVPPGTRPAVLAAVLRRDLDADSAAVVEALADPDLAAELGTDTAHLFGYMRPNSFDLYWTTDERGAVRRLKREWNRFWTDDMQTKADALGLSRDEVVTLASIVEWEARQREERPRIAGVYLNRLLGRTRAGRMRLQADPTVQYALMQEEGGRMRRLLFADYRFPHPYNTYLIDGLPPGPINNPSESSVRAVLDAEEHDYLYFVATGDGDHVFSRTLREHNNAAERYRALMRERRRSEGGGR
ncbi:MAG: endolytic transglycosylase MltG [Bacteroidota bacterium]